VEIFHRFTGLLNQRDPGRRAAGIPDRWQKQLSFFIFFCNYQCGKCQIRARVTVKLGYTLISCQGLFLLNVILGLVNLFVDIFLKGS
jgi:hypothetical protein